MFLNNLLLLLFLFLLPTQLGKHFFLPFSFLSGVRVDYLAPTIYLLDVVFVFLVILNKKTVLSFLKNKKLFLLLFLIFLNFLFSQNKFISFYHYLRFFEIIAIFFIFKKSKLPPKQILGVFVASSLIQLVLSLGQLVSKHSLQGIFYFLGERYFNLSTPGVAKAAFSGVEFLRPYGSFSHPNSMAGFYLLLYFFILTNRKFDKFIFLKNIFLLISSILVFISFSKIAVFTYIILNTLYLLLNKKNNCILCLVSKLFVFLAIALIFLSAQTDPLTISKRLYLAKNSFLVIRHDFLFGVGAGNYLLSQNKLVQKYLDIINQPVHNIFLLFFSEWGLTAIGFFYLIFGWIKKVFRKNYILLLLVIFTGFFDHYWLTLVQNFLLLPVVFGFL